MQGVFAQEGYPSVQSAAVGRGLVETVSFLGMLELFSALGPGKHKFVNHRPPALEGVWGAGA